MRLSDVEDSAITDPEDQAILARIRERRGSRGVIALDRALLHSPPVADGWNTFLGAIRTKTTLATSIREAIICRVAVLNRAWYEWKQHVPLLQNAQDMKVTPAFVQQVFAHEPRKWLSERPEGQVSMQYALALQLTDVLTLDCHVPQSLIEELKNHFTDRAVVEITATCSAYNCVSRFLVALDVGECDGDNGLKIAIESTQGLDKNAVPATGRLSPTK